MYEIFALPPLTHDDVLVIILLSVAVIFGAVILGFVIALARGSGEKKACSFCNSMVPASAAVCKHCGRKLPPVESKPA